MKSIIVLTFVALWGFVLTNQSTTKQTPIMDHMTTSSLPNVSTFHSIEDIPNLCEKYRITLMLEIQNITFNATLHRFCDNKKLIDFTLPIQKITIFRGFDTRGFFKDPKYGERFILDVVKFNNITRLDPVMIVPGYIPAVTDATRDFVKTQMKIDVGNVQRSYVEANTISPNDHIMKSEKILLYPGWSGKLETRIEQLFVPSESSTYIKQNVTVAPASKYSPKGISLTAIANNETIIIFFHDN